MALRTRWRRATLAFLLGVAALALSGCATIVPIGGGNSALTFWQGPSDNIRNLASPKCIVDLNDNGIRGDPYDITACSFFVIRISLCDKLNPEGHARAACYAGTNINGRTVSGGSTAESFFEAELQFIIAQGDCLEIRFRNSDRATVRWAAVDFGEHGCVV